MNPVISSEFEDNMLEASVVKTVRNLKKKKPSQMDETDEIPSRSESTIHFGKKSPLTTHMENDPNVSGTPASSMTNTSAKKTRKIKNSNVSVNASITDNGFVSPTSQDGKNGVFRRLGMSKGPATVSRDNSKKTIRKETFDVNFFDSYYGQLIPEFVDSILSKSRAIKSLLETSNLSREYITKQTVNDVHFNICFKVFLNQLYKEGEINPELKNPGKSAMAKIEKFIVEKVEVKLKLDSLEASIENNFKEAEIMNQNRISELTGKLSG